MRLGYAVLISLLVAGAFTAATQRKAVTVVDAPFETGREVMTCDSLDEATRVTKLSQKLSETAGATMLDVDGAIEAVNSETGRHSCAFGLLRYGMIIEDIGRISGESGMVMFRVFKFSKVTSFKPTQDAKGEHDWQSMLNGPVDQYVVVPSYGSVI